VRVKEIDLEISVWCVYGVFICVCVGGVCRVDDECDSGETFDEIEHLPEQRDRAKSKKSKKQRQEQEQEK